MKDGNRIENDGHYEKVYFFVMAFVSFNHLQIYYNIPKKSRDMEFFLW
jgi:hypothetical protein